MKSTWRVTSNRVGDNPIYGVYRLRDTSEVDHSGNREMHGGYTEDKAQAQAIADELNAAGGLNENSNDR